MVVDKKVSLPAGRLHLHLGEHLSDVHLNVPFTAEEIDEWTVDRYPDLSMGAEGELLCRIFGLASFFEEHQPKTDSDVRNLHLGSRTDILHEMILRDERLISCGND